MNIQDTIDNWKKKPKELVEFLTTCIIQDEKLMPQLIGVLREGNDVDK